ncbi:MAG: tyrosine--tRNA ligase [Clostridiales bacterium]|nr:tyrosine--tRNA ligase [Clostridiales bacterium]
MFDVMGFISELEKECSDFKRDLSGLEIQEQIDIIKQSCSHIYPVEDLIKEFSESKRDNRPLVIKFGMDPMNVDISIDHMVPIVLLNKLQRMGNKIVFVIGDFTALIGDPSDVSVKQKKVNKKKIDANVKTLKKDMQQFLDMAKIDMRSNSSWLNDLKLPELVEIMLELKVSPISSGELLRDKLNDRDNFSYAELIYPLTMGIDSLRIKADLELGREDQLYNFRICRHMMEIKGMKPEVIMTTQALPDGEIFTIKEEPIEIFHKIVQLDNKNVMIWYKLLTEILPDTTNKLENAIYENNINMQTVKEVLAKVIVAKLYGEEKSISTYIEYIKDIVKTTDTKEIRMIHGSKMTIGELIAASTDFTLPEAEHLVKTGGARALSCDGGCLTYILNSDADISTIYFDKFYIIVDDKLVLRITK